jgi:hypothetical protein
MSYLTHNFYKVPYATSEHLVHMHQFQDHKKKLGAFASSDTSKKCTANKRFTLCVSNSSANSFIEIENFFHAA